MCRHLPPLKEVTMRRRSSGSTLASVWRSRNWPPRKMHFEDPVLAVDDEIKYTVCEELRRFRPARVLTDIQIVLLLNYFPKEGKSTDVVLYPGGYSDIWWKTLAVFTTKWLEYKPPLDTSHPHNRLFCDPSSYCHCFMCEYPSVYCQSGQCCANLRYVN